MSEETKTPHKVIRLITPPDPEQGNPRATPTTIRKIISICKEHEIRTDDYEMKKTSEDEPLSHNVELIYKAGKQDLDKTMEIRHDDGTSVTLQAKSGNFVYSDYFEDENLLRISEELD